MADPLGLVSLGIDGAGRLLKVKKRIRRRKAALLQLSSQLDDAHKLLVGDVHSVEDTVIYEDVLIPPMTAALALLEREHRRAGLASAFSKYFHASEDIEEIERLVQNLKDAPSEIQTRRVARDTQIMRLNIELIRTHNELATHTPLPTGHHPAAVTMCVPEQAYTTSADVMGQFHVLYSFSHLRGSQRDPGRLK